MPGMMNVPSLPTNRVPVLVLRLRNRSRRNLTLWQELALYLGRVVSLPLRRALQASMARWLQASGRGYHLVLLQLSFDTSMQVHSRYGNSAQFVGECIDAFARGGATEDFLVFKSHPFEDGRERLGRVIPLCREPDSGASYTCSI